MLDLMIYRRFKKCRERGFTLIEIMAAIMIFSIIAAGVSMTMSETTKLTKRVRARESTVLGAQVAIDRLQRDLQMAFDDKIRNSASTFRCRDISRGPELIFSYLDSPLKVLFEARTSGVKLVRYFLDSAEGGTLRLMRAEVPFTKKDEIERAPAREVAKGLLDLKFEFYDFKNDLWEKSWDYEGPSQSGIFPRAIKISLSVTDPNLGESERKEKALRLMTAFQVLNEMETRQK